MVALITGTCGCGAVRFEIDRPLLSASYCHCTRCQHRTGSGAAATARAEQGSVRIVEGADALRGRKFTPTETILRVAGGPIDPEPYLRYLADKNASLAAA
jgi:hypothetical protein